MIRSWSRLALPVTAGLFVACAVIQVFLAGLGVFDDPKAFITHREFGYTFGWLTLVVLVLGLVGGAPRRVIGLGVLLLVLFALQSVLIAVRSDYPAVAALHPLNGFAVLAVGVVTTRRAWATRRVGEPDARERATGSAPATAEAR